MRAGGYGAFDASARAAGGGASGVRRGVRWIRAGEDERRPKSEAGMGCGAINDGGARVGQSGAESACDILRGAGVAVLLSVASKAGGTD